MALARALAVDPEVLLDEPFATHSMPRGARRACAWLRRLHDEVHVNTVPSPTYQAEALDVADRTHHKGRIEQVGSPTGYDAPANAFVMSFLGAVSTLNGSLVLTTSGGRTPNMAVAAADSTARSPAGTGCCGSGGGAGPRSRVG